MKRNISILIVLGLCWLACASRLGAAPLATAIAYQGRLNSGGNPANGQYDLTFRLYDAVTAGTQAGPTVTTSSVPVRTGLFSVQLDFGPGVFDGTAYWLEISVRPTGGGNFTTLTPRQALLAVPYAQYAPTAGSASSVAWSAISGIPSGFADGTDNDTTYTAGAGLALNGTAFSVSALGIAGSMLADSSITAPKIAGGQVVRSLNGLTDAVTLTAGPNVTLVPSGNSIQIAAAGGGATGWSLAGNSGTSPGANFLGTTDDQPIELRANGARALSLDYAFRAGGAGGGPIENPSAVWGVNILGGLDINFIGNGVVGATIAGGGYGSGSAFSPNYLSNSIAADFGTVSGGAGNHLFGMYGVIGGGKENSSSTDFSVIGGGQNNLIMNSILIGSSPAGTIGGGEGNTIRGGSWNTIGGGQGNLTGPSVPGDQQDYATVGGGRENNAEGGYSTVPGGYRNWAPGGFSFAAGRQAKAVHSGAFVWADSRASDFFSIADDEFAVRAAGGVRIVGTLTTQVLTITGGADLAEPFALSSAQVPKGSVVVIDEDHPGCLRVSDKAYDTRVAGIVSGANGVQPGVSLHQTGALEGGENVALSGRVYVLADANPYSIRPGDLLTTSATLGHAMKVTDHARAQGAVLGKAMSTLEEGRGLVLVLVSLQ